MYSVLDSNLESPAWVWDAECASGVLDSKDPLLDFGDYQVVYAAVSYISEEDYEVVEVSEPISVYVDIAGVLDLPAVTFGR